MCVIYVNIYSGLTLISISLMVEECMVIFFNYAKLYFYAIILLTAVISMYC